MDPNITLMYVASRGKFIPRNSCRVILSRENNRKRLPPQFEDSIDKVWDTRVQQNNLLFNGSKFRVASIDVNSEGRTILNLGLTCYKDFIGTNWSPDAKWFQELGRRHHGNSQAFMSDALGVGALVLTSDNHVILQRRSENCGEAGGLWDVPGGHAEPEEIVGKVDISDMDPGDLPASDVCNEVFDSILREVRDEVNIPLCDLDDPKLIGVARNTTSAGRPSLEFLVSCHLSAAEVAEGYHRGTQPEAEESTTIRLIPHTVALTLQESDKDLWSKLAPSAKGCLTLYRTVLSAR
ncbi:uridine diphosphate glucose pyrophosphatase NUDT22-like [Liolophura sinensis]|uniref:uridine diphosphate glucose pyrophosphatase NUDT22-like n=1 Tax=Liolophura sinensis TaxID=3198878 RepID=UPI003158141E